MVNVYAPAGKLTNCLWPNPPALQELIGILVPELFLSVNWYGKPYGFVKLTYGVGPTCILPLLPPEYVLCLVA